MSNKAPVSSFCEVFQELRYSVPKTCGRLEYRGRLFLENFEGRDKLLKLSDAILDLLQTLMTVFKASEEAHKTVSHIRRDFRLARDICGLFNIFAGMVGTLIHNMQTVFALTTVIAKGEVPAEGINLKQLEKNKADPEKETKFKIYDKAGLHQASDLDAAAAREAAMEEIKWAWGFKSAEVVSNASYITAFGLCKPLTIIDARFHDLGPAAREIGKGFMYVWTVRHIAALLSSFAQMVYNSKVYNNRSHSNVEFAENERDKVQKAAFLGFTENLLELGIDATKFVSQFVPAHQVVPDFIRLPLALGAALVGVYKVWGKSAA